jgi:hypothetical protein
VITEHPTFHPPSDPSVSVWKYMNLSKFVWMLQKRAVYFCRCDLLGDPYEGHYPKALPDGEDNFVRSFLATSAKSLPDAENTARAAFRDSLTQLRNSLKNEMFVSCWHMNEEESLAMWKLYTSHNESICIRSTYQVLVDLLPPECNLGRVNYIDYRRDKIPSGDTRNYIVHKRVAFQHEREARAVVWKKPKAALPFPDVDGKGLVVPVNLQQLVSEIFVSPESEPMLREIVEGIARTYGINAPVQQSTANDPPSY